MIPRSTLTNINLSTFAGHCLLLRYCKNAMNTELLQAMEVEALPIVSDLYHIYMLYVDVFCKHKVRKLQYTYSVRGYKGVPQRHPLSPLSAWAMIFKLPALKVLRASNMALVQLHVALWERACRRCDSLRDCLRCIKKYWTGHELPSKAARHECTRKFAFRHSVVTLHEIVTRPKPRPKRHIRTPHRSFHAGETLFFGAILRYSETLTICAAQKHAATLCAGSAAFCREMNTDEYCIMNVHPYLLSVFSASFHIFPNLSLVS